MSSAVATKDYAANITPSIDYGALNAKDYATLYAVHDPFLDSLKAGARYPISYVARIGRLKDKDGWIFPYINQYIANGQIFDDSQVNQRSVLFGGDPTAFDQTSFGFSLPTDIQRTNAVKSDTAIVLNPTTEATPWTFVDSKATAVVPLLANNNAVDSIIANAKPNTAITATPADLSTITPTPADVGATTDAIATTGSASTSGAVSTTDIQNASTIYDNSLPPVIENSLAVKTTASYTGLYILGGLIVAAIAYKKINFKKRR